MYIQLQAEALFGVRLGAARLSELLILLYGYAQAKEGTKAETMDVRQAREDVDTDALYHNEALARSGLYAAIRQSIPGDVVTVSEQLAEVR
ncbi:hypothetical protein [Vibrio sp. TBV020]|uniref:hypothetical protein n=1 Tax=Vibrio sp. TBV020 TaxID=3137398 RepID=UPI0038CDB566